MKKQLVGYWNSFSFVGLIIATLFFSASVTPSLLPRNYIVQGLLSGFSVAIGYGIGVGLVYFYRFLELREPTGRTQTIAKRLTVAVVALAFASSLWHLTFWQNSIRERMDMPQLESAYPYQTAIIAIAFGAFVVALGRILIRCTLLISSKLQHFLPRRIAHTIGFILVAIAVLFLTNDVIAKQLLYSADSFFLNLDELADDELAAPQDPGQTGSEQSLVSWDTVGRQGKLFLTKGPTQDEIATFRDRSSLSPIRVYVGMRSRPSREERAKLALEELIRVGGFERSVLIVATPTGTGWLDPSAVDPIEYLHGGDTAIVSMQYSYLPSWITILVDPRRSIESADALFDAIYDHWRTLPKKSRPKLYLQGLSLGSLGSEVSADLFKIFEDPIDGAVWSGPPFPSKSWNNLVRDRNQGSPARLPVIRKSRMVRFTSQTNALQTGKAWGPIRCVYVQYASDPMVWFSPDLAWQRPDWLGDQRGPDVSPYLRWYPIITFLQVAFDLPVATAVPIGYGHNYSPSNYIDAWKAVTEPSDWTPRDISRLKKLFAEQETPKP